ncbi:hypothetical protein MRBLMI12_000447 [Microbacterium sp. LMI12-1-1.1]|uniref:hypothetical protein n=1 Tax=Microbacterium sp. LMI12-1-1.1 TaxID=3135225 RepID=UPI003430C0C3
MMTRPDILPDIFVIYGIVATLWVVVCIAGWLGPGHPADKRLAGWLALFGPFWPIAAPILFILSLLGFLQTRKERP